MKCCNLLNYHQEESDGLDKRVSAVSQINILNLLVFGSCICCSLAPEGAVVFIATLVIEYAINHNICEVKCFLNFLRHLILTQYSIRLFLTFKAIV